MPWALLDFILEAGAIAAPPPTTAATNTAANLPPGSATPSAAAGGSAGRAQAEKVVLERLVEAIRSGLSMNVMQRVPHLVLLSDAYYVSALRPVLADWLLLWLRRQGLRDIRPLEIKGCNDAFPKMGKNIFKKKPTR